MKFFILTFGGSNMDRRIVAHEDSYWVGLYTEVHLKLTEVPI